MMNAIFNYKTALLTYRASGQMPRELYEQLTRLVRVVLRSKGVDNASVYDEVQSAFFEKILKFKSLFYTKLALYSEAQTRSFLSMTIHSVLMDHYRREQSARFSSLDALEQPEQLLPETTWNQYKLEAHSLYRQLWSKLSAELRSLFCLLYSGGKNVEAAAEIRKVSVGKIHKDKVRIAELIAPEASIEEVAQMAYRLMALEFCCQDQPVSSA